MKVSLLDYALPERLVAQVPAPRRRDARLMAVCRATGEIVHLSFADFPGLLRPSDLLVVNDTKVIRGRLRGRKETGAAVEILLLAPLPADDAPGEPWEALARPSRRLRPEMTLSVGAGLRVALSRPLGAGRWAVRLSAPGTVTEALERAGEMPLPPYIRRRPGSPEAAADAERYQTVYAADPGSVAAPTAGLHFDGEMLDEIGRAGTAIAGVTLSVGYGTFSPIRTDDVEAHAIHPEPYRLGPETAAACMAAKSRGGRVVAVGTTSVRTLETCADASGAVAPGEGTTRLFIVPGHRFRAVDALLTNFHLPRSSLLALVMAFGGVDLIREAYARAVADGYRFFSYGDAMFVH
ncbi:MAG: tRNA preQ1(34) S-adenosylmethionine ribosyltransferase-isomerase QueA [Gemmatimonadota bacterium]